MIFLLDTDICSAHMRRPGKLAHRFIQYQGQLAISSVTLAELYAGVYKHSQVNRRRGLVDELFIILLFKYSFIFSGLSSTFKNAS